MPLGEREMVERTTAPGVEVDYKAGEIADEPPRPALKLFVNPGNSPLPSCVGLGYLPKLLF